VRTDPRPAARGLVAIVLACALAGGCGYSLTGSTLPAHIRTVAVPVFVNRTQEPGVENFITRAVAEAFTTSSGLKVVDPAGADAILEGEIVGYALQPLSYNQAANVREYRLVVTVNLRFKDATSGEMLLDEKGVQEKSDFSSAEDVSNSIARAETALRQAATDIGRAIVNLAITRF
jgi:outer membrane lipopolysaccharide assembly protein LptE/RlpB